MELSDCGGALAAALPSGSAEVLDAGARAERLHFSWAAPPPGLWRRVLRLEAGHGAPVLLGGIRSR